MKTVISLLCLCLAMVSFAGEKVIQVGLGSLDYPPFYFEEKDKMKGAAVEISETIASRLGYRLDYKRYPWKRVQKLLASGNIEMMILYFKTPEREKDAYFTDTPHINESSYLFVRKGITIDYPAWQTGQSQRFDIWQYQRLLSWTNVRSCRLFDQT